MIISLCRFSQQALARQAKTIVAASAALPSKELVRKSIEDNKPDPDELRRRALLRTLPGGTKQQRIRAQSIPAVRSLEVADALAAYRKQRAEEAALKPRNRPVMRLARLRRTRNNPEFHIVINVRHKAAQSQPMERLGFYDPIPRSRDGLMTKRVEWDTDRIKYWLDQGIEVSSAVKKLLRRSGILPPARFWCDLRDIPESAGRGGTVKPHMDLAATTKDVQQAQAERINTLLSGYA